MNYSKCSDKEIFALCKRFGSDALEARRKFAGLLPEVLRRRLYERRGFESIYHFAAKLAGMSHEQVDLVIRIERKLEDRPVLQRMLVSGEVSVNKLVRVVSITTPENEKEIAEKVKNLSQQAVEAFVKDVQIEKVNGLQEPLIDDKTMRAHCKTSDINQDVKLMSILTPEIKERLMELANRGLDINQILTEMLDQREQKIQQEKEQISKTTKQTTSRHICTKTMRIMREEWGTKCSKLGCDNPAEHIHHEKQFAIYNMHDPKYLKPLCAAHHELVHAP